jgi:NhaA family Na+:H+ antiporter
VRQGWAVPTATDIAFAVGVLALLGKSIPPSVRIFLLALAIIDDIIAVLIIAVFFGGIDPVGLMIAGTGISLVLVLQTLGIGSTYAYLIPGAVLWIGLYKTGIHPTLAGVVLGLMTPVTRDVDHAVGTVRYAIDDFVERFRQHPRDAHELMLPIKHLKFARRALLPPVVRVQTALHPWVAFGIMPLFALANAGVNLGGVDLTHGDSLSVMLGISLALVLGKPMGILFCSWALVRLGWCKLPEAMTWSWMLLIGCLGGIGFTMSIFIANLAFSDATLLTAAKLGILLASAAACAIGLALGALLVFRKKALERKS